MRSAVKIEKVVEFCVWPRYKIERDTCDNP